MDGVISQLRERFRSHTTRAFSLQSLLPEYCVDRPYASIEPAIKLFEKYLPCGREAVEVEYMRWQTFWEKRKNLSVRMSVVDVLKEASSMQTFPSIAILLQIYATFPVATATNERSFSALKYIKNYLRSTMSETSLNGLVSSYVHRDVQLNYDDVIREFCKKHRRLDFL